MSLCARHSSRHGHMGASEYDSIILDARLKAQKLFREGMATRDRVWQRQSERQRLAERDRETVETERLVEIYRKAGRR